MGTETGGKGIESDVEAELTPDEQRYLELVDSILNRMWPGLSSLVASAYEPRDTSLDTLINVRARHNQLLDLRRDLKAADAEYLSLLSELKGNMSPSSKTESEFDALSKTTAANQDGMGVNVEQRIIDFIWGLLASIGRDFSKHPDLNLLAQELLASSSF